MSIVAFKLDPKADALQDDFARHGAELPGAGLQWLEVRRAKAMEAFAKTGIPNRRVEAWKYTDLASAFDGGWKPVVQASKPVKSRVVPMDAGSRVTFADGRVQSIEAAGPGIEIVDLTGLGGSTPDWVKAHFGTHAAGSDQPLGAASFGLMRSGVAIRVTGIHENLYLEFADAAMDRLAHIRVLIVVEQFGHLNLHETHFGKSAATVFTNLGMELVLKNAAKVEHIRVQQAPPTAVHVASIGGELARHAEYRALYAALGGKLARVDVNLRLAEERASATIHNVAVLDGGIADLTTVMDHASPHTTSRQLFKSVVGGHARSVNQGRVTVREGAVKSDSHQLFKALLLGPRAEADAKPELEIFADDVVCGHGTAIGALEADALFYLRARGIPEAEAKGLLIRAFLQETIEGFGDEKAQDALWARLDTALAAAGSAV